MLACGVAADIARETTSELRLRVTALADSIAGILDLSPIESARLAPRLIDDGKSVLSVVRKASITSASSSMSHAEIAECLGVSISTVNQAIIEHRAGAVSAAISHDAGERDV
jgi:hypothetical protein